MRKFAFAVFLLAATTGLAHQPSEQGGRPSGLKRVEGGSQQSSLGPARSNQPRKTSNQPPDTSNQPRGGETDVSEMRKRLKEIESQLIDEMSDEMVKDRLAKRLVADDWKAFRELAEIEKKLQTLAEKYPNSSAAQRARQAAVILRGTAADGTVDR